MGNRYVSKFNSTWNRLNINWSKHFSPKNILNIFDDFSKLWREKKKKKLGGFIDFFLKKISFSGLYFEKSSNMAKIYSSFSGSKAIYIHLIKNFPQKFWGIRHWIYPLANCHDADQTTTRLGSSMVMWRNVNGMLFPWTALAFNGNINDSFHLLYTWVIMEYKYEIQNVYFEHTLLTMYVRTYNLKIF